MTHKLVSINTSTAESRSQMYELLYNEVVKNINPFDIASGKVVQNNWATFWFKSAGNNMLRTWDGPIMENLHRDNDKPCLMDKHGRLYYGENGVIYAIYNYHLQHYSMQARDDRKYKLIPE